MPSFRSAASSSASGPSTQSSPLPTPPRSRAAIDDDLAGLIDVPAGEPPAPEAAPAVSPVEAAREKWANLLNPGGPPPAGAAPLSRKASAPAAAKMESPATPAAVSGLTPGAQSSTPGGSGLFAPRKGGFYPPQEPVRMDVPLPHAAGFVPPATAVEPSPAAAAKPTPTSDTPAAAAGVAPALAPVAKLADPLAPKAPSAVDVSAASARALDELAAGLNKSVTPASAPLPERPPAREPAREPEGRAASSSSTPVVSAPLAVPGTVTAPTAAVPLEKPAAKKAPPETLNGQSPVASEASAPSPTAAAGGRSFEEVVAEMLRPMLEKWIDENMPRIVERALKLDASSGSKTDS